MACSGCWLSFVDSLKISRPVRFGLSSDFGEGESETYLIGENLIVYRLTVEE
jgi:hypothetical protein